MAQKATDATDAQDETETATAPIYEQATAAITAAAEGDIMSVNGHRGTVEEVRENETNGRVCVSVIVRSEGERYRAAATEPGRAASETVRFGRDTTGEEVPNERFTDDTLGAISMPVSPDQDGDGCPECSGDIYVIEHTTETKRFRCVQCDYEFSEAELDDQYDEATNPDQALTNTLMDQATATQAAETGPDTDGTDAGEDQEDDVTERIKDLGESHWAVAQALSSAPDGLTIRQLVEDHVDTKKPWTQRCARDLCDADVAEREKDGRAYVYSMKPVGAAIPEDTLMSGATPAAAAETGPDTEPDTPSATEFEAKAGENDAEVTIFTEHEEIVAFGELQEVSDFDDTLETLMEKDREGEVDVKPVALNDEN